MHTSIKTNNQFIQEVLINESIVLCSLIEHCTARDIRLYGGNYYFGAVQVCVDGLWGSVCRDSFWDNNDASVVCKQLGFSPYGMYYSMDYLP